MVFYFTSQVDPTVTLFMGKDKFENEYLIKYCQKHDIWFHVADLSSAHVYLRTKEPITSYDELTPEQIMECAQLTKANSIEGCKKASVGINYTWATNLLKTNDMSVGSVSYKSNKQVKNINIEKDKDIVRKLIKTKREETPNYEAEYKDYL